MNGQTLPKLFFLKVYKKSYELKAYFSAFMSKNLLFIFFSKY